MKPLNANDARRYVGFKVWTPFEAALLLAGCKPLPRSHIPEPKGNTPAFNLIQAIQLCGPSKNLETMHSPENWILWYKEYLAGYDFPEFSLVTLRAFEKNKFPSFQKTQHQNSLTTSTGAVLKSENPQPVVTEQAVTDGTALEGKRTKKRLAWRDIAMPYVVETYRVGKYKTAHTFYIALVNKAQGGNSPFTCHNRELFLTDLGQAVSKKTIANAMKEIKAAARLPLI